MVNDEAEMVNGRLILRSVVWAAVRATGARELLHQSRVPDAQHQLRRAGTRLATRDAAVTWAPTLQAHR